MKAGLFETVIAMGCIITFFTMLRFITLVRKETVMRPEKIPNTNNALSQSLGISCTGRRCILASKCACVEAFTDQQTDGLQ